MFFHAPGPKKVPGPGLSLCPCPCLAKILTCRARAGLPVLTTLISIFIFFCFCFVFLGWLATEIVDEREIGVGVVIKWNERRVLDENSKNSTTLILAANRTHRRDPKDGFKFYTGGWNITNEHYLYVSYFKPLSISRFFLFNCCLK